MVPTNRVNPSASPVSMKGKTWADSQMAIAMGVIAPFPQMERCPPPGVFMAGEWDLFRGYFVLGIAGSAVAGRSAKNPATVR